MKETDYFCYWTEKNGLVLVDDIKVFKEQVKEALKMRDDIVVGVPEFGLLIHLKAYLNACVTVETSAEALGYTPEETLELFRESGYNGPSYGFERPDDLIKILFEKFDG